MPHDPTDLADLAELLARQAAAVLRDRPDDLDVDAKSSPTDAVTVMDRSAEKVIVEGIAAARPHDRVVAEEGSDRDGDSGVAWYVDPLDGTVNYLYGVPQFAVSIGVGVGETVVAGVIVDVMRNDVYRAVLGDGATVDGRPLRCTQETDPAMALVATGFGYSPRTREWQAGVVSSVLPRVRDIRRFGSAALDLCAVAAGRVDAYFEAAMNVWDWAAGALIAREAGARVEGLEERSPGSGVLLAANPRLFAALHDLLVDAGAAELPPA